MTRIAFLACAETLPPTGPNPGPRRGDAFEHDLEIAALRPAFEAAGMDLVELDWRAPIEDFTGIDLALLGTAWDYQDHPEAFLTRLDELAGSGIAVCNPPDIVRWNADKGYLRELAQRGVPTIPTRWHDDAGRDQIAAAMDDFATDRVVVKRRVGAGALGQHSFSRDSLPDSEWHMGHACLIQPFLASVVEEGEYTFVFIDGQFSHGVLKRAAAGDYRIQSLYGGVESVYTPGEADLANAEAVIAALPFVDPLYARIDMARLPSRELAVMEAELIEPYLYPQQGPDLGERMAEAVRARLARQS
ncbi:MAG: hypothetical protein VX454_01450 [Pseudomonadota bacterium]|nr:hypothetical protein [Pseudomonadota bacterium]